MDVLGKHTDMNAEGHPQSPSQIKPCNTALNMHTSTHNEHKVHIECEQGTRNFLCFSMCLLAACSPEVNIICGAGYPAHLLCNTTDDIVYRY